MKIIAVSDLHGRLPVVPECDLLLIAGDICPNWDHSILFQSQWLGSDFREWLEKVPAKKIVAVWGNHDFIAEKNPVMLPRLPWEILTDQRFTYEGLNIYGMPWQTRFFDWAFNLDEPDLARKYSRIPDDTHIIVSHGPPYGHGDLAPPIASIGRHDWEHTGSPSLLARIQEIKPLLTVFGHIHCSRGITELEGHPECKLVNASVLNEKYQMVHPPVEVEIVDGKITYCRDLE